MNITIILEQLDHLFVSHQINKVEPFLLEQIEQAKIQGDISSHITLLNEIIGFYRDTSQYAKSLKACEDVISIMNGANMQGSIPYATTLLNIANALRAAKDLEASKIYYEHVFALYEQQLDSNDFRFASLNNNMSLLYQEMEDWEMACQCLEKALAIASLYPEAMIEVATTHTNLAMSLLKLKKVEEAMEHLEQAFAVFEKDEDKDYHYSAALAAMGEARVLKGELEEAAKYYEKAMKEIERNIGQTEGYEIMKHNLQSVQEKIAQGSAVATECVASTQTKSGLEIARDYYETVGKPMLEEKFSDYIEKIAVGLVGCGSECFGFDDEISRDHDFGPGFCIWLTEQDYAVIGEEMQKEYDKLPTLFDGMKRLNLEKSGKRVGVFSIPEFYKKLITIDHIPSNIVEWFYIQDDQYAAATNGEVFEDYLGQFSEIRKQLKEYYPQEVWAEKIAKLAILISQTGQYNYYRALKRNDKVTAAICLIDFIKYTMQMSYLLNRTYAPFYKWLYKGMENQKVVTNLKVLVEDLQSLPVGNENIPATIETIVSIICTQLKEYGFTTLESNYLDDHVAEIRKNGKDNVTQEELVDAVVTLEWEAFDKVDNETGRADCQDNYDTFSVMRKSQFLAWPKQLVASYLNDIKEANAKNWNLITEKYGRMMESTDPEGYAKIKDRFPVIEEQRNIIIEEIVRMQVTWMEEFASKYPRTAGNARSIRTGEDSLFNTSYETYLRGELKSYSPKTMELYGRFIVELARSQQNLAYNIITNTAKLYGYDSIEEMEKG